MTTDRFLPIDGALWSVAVALFAFALWLTRKDVKVAWDPAVFFGGALTAMFGKGKLPLREGPVPPEGWDGAAEELEVEYDPRARLGPEVAWADVASWSEPARAAVARRLAGVKLVWLEPPVLDLPGLEPVVTDADGLPALFPRPEDRMVLAASASANRALEILHASPALRDRLRAVLLVAPALDREWLAVNFHQAAFDVEVAREVPYLTLRTPPAPDAQRLPDPPPPPSGLTTVAVVDLGVLDAELLADPRVGRALAALLAALG